MSKLSIADTDGKIITNKRYSKIRLQESAVEGVLMFLITKRII